MHKDKETKPVKEKPPKAPAPIIHPVKTYFDVIREEEANARANSRRCPPEAYPQ